METGRYEPREGAGLGGLPDVIEVRGDGAVIAFFGNEPSLRYEDLGTLLERYRIAVKDLRPSRR
jgi:hypothetical protein